MFSESELTTQGTDISIKEAFRELEVTYKENLRSWWELQTLEKYTKEKIVPRGLRINIAPGTRSRSSELLNKWEEASIKGSLLLMGVLIEEEKKAFDRSLESLNKCIENTLRFKGDDEFNRRENFLQNSIEKFQTTIKSRKHTQYARDTQEFREKRAYNFDAPINRSSSNRGSDLDTSDSEQPPRPRGGGFWRSRGRGRGRKWQNPPTREQSKGPIENRTSASVGASSSASSSNAPSFLEQERGRRYDFRERQNK